MCGLQVEDDIAHSTTIPLRCTEDVPSQPRYGAAKQKAFKANDMDGGTVALEKCLTQPEGVGIEGQHGWWRRRLGLLRDRTCLVGSMSVPTLQMNPDAKRLHGLMLRNQV